MVEVLGSNVSPFSKHPIFYRGTDVVGNTNLFQERRLYSVSSPFLAQWINCLASLINHDMITSF